MSGTAYAAASDGLYGKIRLGLKSQDELDLVSSKLVFGFKGAEDLGNGLVASYGIEFENDSADEEKTGVSNDKSWVKLGGSFGEFIVGEHGDMAGYACGGTDILTYGSAEACNLGHNDSAANAIQYRGSAGDVDFGLIMIQDGTGDSDMLIGLKYSTGPFSVGVQAVKSDADAAVVKAVEDAATALAADPSNSDLAEAVDAAQAEANFGSTAPGDTGYIVGATYTINGITLGVTMGDTGADDNNTATDIGVSAPLGNGTVVAVISSGDAVSDSTDLGYSAALGKASYYGFEYNKVDGVDDDAITAYIGMNF